METVRQILLRNIPANTTVWVFGSRAKGDNRPYSDLDLALHSTAKIERKILLNLAIEFEESDLPWSVDIVDTQNVSENFLKIIEQDKVVFPLSES